MNAPEVKKDTESYRDHIATVNESGARNWIYPKKPAGKFYDARTIVSIVLLIFLFGAPLMKINGQPMILLNVIERKFILFGLAFWPQDFHLFALAVLTFIVFIILFTVVFGRVWCGWACPQTIFMEMVFRKIEYWIEGDARQQRALNKAPWTMNKITKKVSKQVIFYALSFLIGNTFLAYIIGIDELVKIVTDPPSQHIAGLTAMIVFSTLFYGVFSWFREQACVIVCPYGRLQGVLLDQSSIVVSYDFKRGEPRGKLRKRAPQPLVETGDCVDCHLCVQVCPTGIDIRNGTQLECVNCTACIDACDSVMEKIKKPKGLIRYSSYQGILDGAKLRFTPRVIGYSVVLTLLLSLFVFLLTNRVPVETSILRTPGVLYQTLEDGTIQNLYNVKIVNKSFDPRTIRFALKSPRGKVKLVSGNELNVSPDGLAESALFVQIRPELLDGVKTIVVIEVLNGEEILETVETSFAGPTALQ